MQADTRSLSPSASQTARRGPRLGFDTSSLRAWQWKAMQLLDFAAEQGLDTIQISSLGDFASLDAAHLKAVREKARQQGITLDAGIGCICPSSASWSNKWGDAPTYVREGLRVSSLLGARAMRCFLGSERDRRGTVPIDAHIENTVKVLRSVRSAALDSGVKIAVENHSGDMQARELRTLIEAAGKDFVGACLDTGNPMQVMEDPMVTLEVLAPYVVTTHIRDSVVYEHPRGAAWQWVALGDGSIDFHAFVTRYRELCPQAGMQLEVITGRPPRVLPYYEQDFWKAFPKADAAEFSRFVALAKKGRPFDGFMVIEDGVNPQPDEYKAALKLQQRRDLERSLAYAKKTLGAGLRA